jgi:hypothetical protein
VFQNSRSPQLRKCAEDFLLEQFPTFVQAIRTTANKVHI